MVHLADFMATIGSLAGYTTNDERAKKAGLPPSDSVDLWPYVMGTRVTSPRREVSINGKNANLAGDNGATLIMLIDGVIYKYIQGRKIDALYDLADNSESINLAEAKPGVLQQMKQRAEALEETEYQAFSARWQKIEKASKRAARSEHNGYWGPWI